MYVQICDILLLFSYNEVRILSDCDLNVMNIVVIVIQKCIDDFDNIVQTGVLVIEFFRDLLYGGRLE